MGLSIEVGSLKHLQEHDPEGAAWLRDDIAAINALLRRAGLPEHAEPSGAEIEVLSFDMRGAGDLGALRAFAVEQAGGAEAAARRYPHLIDHDDSEGYYIPTPFAEVLHDPAGEVPGGAVGSSQRLLAELEQLGEALGLTADTRLGEVATAPGRGARSLARPWRRAGSAADDAGESPAARAALRLLAAARYSVRSGALIVFC